MAKQVEYSLEQVESRGTRGNKKKEEKREEGRALMFLIMNRKQARFGKAFIKICPSFFVSDTNDHTPPWR